MKTIDIRKPVASTKGPQTRRVGNLPEEKSPEEKPTHEEKPIVMESHGKKSFTSRFVEIAIFDVKRKLGLVKKPAGELQQKVSDFEKFENFCKMSRGEK